jgi:uncharacterized protein (TIGR03083 family)
MPDFPAAYDDLRRRVSAVVRDPGPTGLDRRVPACPDWSVKDVVGHLEHVSEEYAEGRHEYSTTDAIEFAAAWGQDRARVEAWADQGVEARRGRSIEALLTEWERRCSRLYEMMRGEVDLPGDTAHGFLAWATIGDAATHYQDIRGALELGPEPDTHGTKLAYSMYVRNLVHRSAALRPQPPALRVKTQRAEVVIGEGEPVEVEVDWFEFLRVISGRRSVEQVAQLLDPVDAEPYLAAFQAYPYPTRPLEV